MKNQWNSELYDAKHSYVFKYGEDLLGLLNPQRGERILDLGSGTGHLTGMIAGSGAIVTGIDNSSDMVDQAMRKYPSIDFRKMDAAGFSFDEKFDAVFSNAVLHWVSKKEKVVKCISDALRPGGRFVAEFGGRGNIINIVEALKKYLGLNGYEQNITRINWYFPSIGEYTSLLEKYGLDAKYAAHFDRDTFLDKDTDITGWLEMFGKEILKGIDGKAKINLLNQIKEYLSSTNIKDGRWFVDYKRLRILAVREN